MKYLILLLLISPALAQVPDYCMANEVPNYGVNALDGPAHLPQRCVATKPFEMPSPNGTVSVAAGGSLQAAYNSAVCGTTIKLAHGNTWAGPFKFSAKGCDKAHWITIESDGKLPPVGTRASAADASQMAKITATGSKANLFPGDHLRIIGIEWGPKDSTSLVYNLDSLAGADHVVFERNLFHGNPIQEVQRAMILNTAKYVAIIDSSLLEFHCTAITGACGDSQGISGGTGTPTDLISQAGPYKIVNNFIEAAAENVSFGGDIADGCPADITVQGNDFYKPPTWNPLNSAFIGTKYIVKNNFELKNACRVLIEGNVFRNNWGGFTQLGYAVLLTPKNQGGRNGANLCPKCIVTDVTFRYNTIDSAAGAMMIASAPNSNGAWSEGIHRVSVHDITASNLQYPGCYACGSTLFLLGSGFSTVTPPPASEVMSDVSIHNINVLAVGDLGGKMPSEFLAMSGPPVNTLGVPMLKDISVTDSVMSELKDGIYTTGGGTNNCMFFATRPATPASYWSACVTGNSPFTANYLIGPALKWPAGNTVVPSIAQVPAGAGANLTLIEKYTKGAQ